MGYGAGEVAATPLDLPPDTREDVVVVGAALVGCVDVGVDTAPPGEVGLDDPPTDPPEVAVTDGPLGADDPEQATHQATGTTRRARKTTTRSLDTRASSLVDQVRQILLASITGC